MVAESRPIAVVAVTRVGSRLAARIAAALPEAEACVPARFAAEAGPTTTAYEGPVAALVRERFGCRRALVLVMAVGAAVRLIAPCLRDKRTDPAVVVVDDGGRFAVALLSGHLGGANALAERVAAITGAQPVVTTAAEVLDVPAADLIGRAFGWRIENPEQLTRLAAALVNGEPVGVLQEAGEPDWHDDPLPAHVRRYPDLAALCAAAPAAAIIITDRLLPATVLQPGWVVYRPRTLVLGIGCSRGVSADEIAALVDETLAAHGLSPLSVRAVATLDRKAAEPGLVAFVRARRLELQTFPAAVLDATPGMERPSAVVKAAVGTRGVCEPAALRAAGAARLLVPKQKGRAATVAVARISA
jgi:cobalt-precorrin 5A hydrolase